MTILTSDTRCQRRAPRRATSRLIAFGLAFSGFVPLLGLLATPPSTALVIYSLFVLVLWWRGSLADAFAATPGPLALRFGLLLVTTGLVAECLAWLNNFLECRENPPLLHPQLGADLLTGFMFYGIWALAWGLVLRRWRFRLPEVFALQGLFGVLLEQRGAVLLQGLSTLPVGLVLWLYVFAVYGSIAAIPYAVGEPCYLPTAWSRRNDRWKYVALPLLIVALALPIGAAWSAVVGPMLPLARPICQSPLW